MGKRRFTYKIVSYGEYKKWDKASKGLPELKKITDTVIADIDVEFGYILNIKGAKGKTLFFIIEHPPFLNDRNEITPPFEGEEFINSNDFNFFLGDKVWEPIDDKIGVWTMKTFIDNALIAEKSIFLKSNFQEELDW